jgi:two-component system KDP operon response regulator KdpE
MRFLVIDNENGIRSFFRKVIEDLGHSCDEAPDGQQGLQLCGDNPYDVVFVDLVMPGLDGEEVLLALRKSHPDLPVIIISVQDEEEAIQELLSLGATAYLTKPVGLQELTQVVQKLARHSAGPG